MGFNRMATDAGFDRSIIVSSGLTVRYSHDRVIIRDALVALFPGMKPISVNVRLQTLAKYPELKISGQIFEGSRGTRFAADLGTFIKMCQIFREIEEEGVWKQGKNPVSLDLNIATQILRGFDRWGRQFFPPDYDPDNDQETRS